MTLRSLRLFAPAFLAASLAASPVLADVAPPPDASPPSDAGASSTPSSSKAPDDSCNAGGKASLSGWLVAFVPLAVTSLLRRRARERAKHTRA